MKLLFEINKKFYIVIGVILSILIALFQLRNVLFKSGIIEAIDIQWNVNKIVWEKHPSYCLWNYGTSNYNLYYLSQFYIYLLPIIMEVEQAQKLTYFIAIFSLCYSSFITAYRILSKYKLRSISQLAGSITATILYSSSPLLTWEYFHLPFLVSISIFPLIFLYSYTLLECRSSTFKYSLVLSFLIALIPGFREKAIALLMFFTLSFFALLSKDLLHVIKRLCLVLMLTSSFQLYWIIPYLMFYLPPPWGESKYAMSQFSFSFLDSLTYRPYVRSEIYGVVTSMLFSTMMLILTIVALLPTIILRKRKEVIYLSTLLVVGVFLANGMNEPSNHFYNLLLYLPVPGLYFIIKYPYIFISITYLSLSLLLSISLAIIFNNILSYRIYKKLKVLLITIFLLIFCLPVVFSPVNSNTFSKMLTPVQLPPGYLKANEFLLSDSDNFRVMWIPLSTAFNWSANPLANRAEYWITPKPSLLYGWGIKSALTPLGDAVYESLLTGDGINNSAKLLAIANTKYIIFQKSIRDLPHYLGLLENLLKQKDFKLEGDFNEVLIFKNLRYQNNTYIYSAADLYLTDYETPELLMTNCQIINEAILTKTDYDQLIKVIGHLNISEPPVLSYEEVNPTTFIINVSNIKGPFLLIFSESFNPYWKIYIKEPRQGLLNLPLIGDLALIFGRPLDEKYHFVTNYYANGWYITTKSDKLMLIIHFPPQSYFYLGLLASVVSILASMGFLFCKSHYFRNIFTKISL